MNAVKHHLPKEPSPAFSSKEATSDETKAFFCVLVAAEELGALSSSSSSSSPTMTNPCSFIIGRTKLITHIYLAELTLVQLLESFDLSRRQGIADNLILVAFGRIPASPLPIPGVFPYALSKYRYCPYQ